MSPGRPKLPPKPARIIIAHSLFGVSGSLRALPRPNEKRAQFTIRLAFVLNGYPHPNFQVLGSVQGRILAEELRVCADVEGKQFAVLAINRQRVIPNRDDFAKGAFSLFLKPVTEAAPGTVGETGLAAVVNTVAYKTCCSEGNYTHYGNRDPDNPFLVHDYSLLFCGKSLA